MGVGTLRDQSRIPPPMGDPAGKEAAHSPCRRAGVGAFSCAGDVIIVVLVVVRLGRGVRCSRSPSHLHHGAVRVQTGQPSSRHLMFIVRKVLCGYLAVASADGRDLGVPSSSAPALARHLGVAADDDISLVRVVGVVRRARLRRRRCLPRCFRPQPRWCRPGW